MALLASRWRACWGYCINCLCASLQNNWHTLKLRNLFTQKSDLSLISLSSFLHLRTCWLKECFIMMYSDSHLWLLQFQLLNKDSQLIGLRDKHIDVPAVLQISVRTRSECRPTQRQHPLRRRQLLVGKHMLVCPQDHPWALNIRRNNVDRWSRYYRSWLDITFVQIYNILQRTNLRRTKHRTLCLEDDVLITLKWYKWLGQVLTLLLDTDRDVVQLDQTIHVLHVFLGSNSWFVNPDILIEDVDDLGHLVDTLVALLWVGWAQLACQGLRTQHLGTLPRPLQLSVYEGLERELVLVILYGSHWLYLLNAVLIRVADHAPTL